MEINVRIKISQKEMEEIFFYDDVINVRRYEHIGNDVFKVRLRIPKCDMKGSRKIKKFDTIKEEVINKCKERFKVVSKVYFKNGEEKIIYSPNNYWEKVNAEEFAKVNETDVIKIERIENVI